MKAKHFFYGLVVLAILFSACKKDKDYRDKWAGEYIGEYIEWFNSMNTNRIDTIRGDIVNVSIGSGSCLLIRRGENTSWTPTINTDGSFTQYEQEDYFYPMCNGNIEGDSIRFSGIYSFSPGL